MKTSRLRFLAKPVEALAAVKAATPPKLKDSIAKSIKILPVLITFSIEIIEL